ncbi:MAG: TldD/PmbA family protein [Chloroflexia bacterium]
MLGEDTIRSVVQGVLDRSKADETEVVYFGGQDQLTRFANSYIHQNVAEQNTGVTVRAVLGKKIGVASTNDLSQNALAGVVERATMIARFQHENEDYKSLPGAATYGQSSGYDPVTADTPPEVRAAGVGAVCKAAADAGLVASGAFSTGWNEIAVGNSHGVFAYAPQTSAQFSTVIMGESGSGYAENATIRVAEIDASALGKEATDKAVRSRDPAAVEPGAYDVVLEEYAVGEMLLYLSFLGMGALALQEGRSFMRLGEEITGNNITIYDDAYDPRGLPFPFDFEGVPRQRVEIIKNGLANAVVYDTYTAGREPGKQSTGHGLPAPNTYGPLPMNLVIAPGTTPKAELIKGIKRGLWVTRFHYVNIVNPMQTILTGMTRDGTFLIEDGAISRPVKNLRFTQSVLDALRRAELSDTLRLQKGFFGGSLVPAMRIEGFNFSSATEF